MRKCGAIRVGLTLAAWDTKAMSRADAYALSDDWSGVDWIGLEWNILGLLWKEIELLSVDFKAKYLYWQPVLRLSDCRDTTKSETSMAQRIHR